tara:strand:- start:1689 stop:1820 length:132 start_codon:yes stop_codon:yes gene_type:complete
MGFEEELEPLKSVVSNLFNEKMFGSKNLVFLLVGFSEFVGSSL